MTTSRPGCLIARRASRLTVWPLCFSALRRRVASRPCSSSPQKNLVWALFFVTLIIGYIIWWLFTLSRAQTPGKRLAGIRVMRTGGTTSDWGWTFIREFLVKFAALGVAGDTVAFSIPTILDLLWAFWHKDRQTLHDKIMKTVVVNDLVLRSRPHKP